MKMPIHYIEAHPHISSKSRVVICHQGYSGMHPLAARRYGMSCECW